MKKLLLLSLMALIPCALLVSGNNNMPQLSGTKPTTASPMQPYMGMNEQQDMTCPTEEEIMNALRQEMTPEQWAEFEKAQKEFAQMSPEQQEQMFMAAMEDMINQLPPEQRAELDETMGLLAMEELEQMGEEILKTPEGQAFAQGVQAGAELGAAAKEQEIIQEAEAILPVLQEAIIEEEAAMIKNANNNKPYAPALK